MRKILTFLITSFVLELGAQDIITLRTGDEVQAKITEVGVTEIKYKKWENLDGPLYALRKTEVFMIKYQNGTKDVFPITNANGQNIQTIDPAKAQQAKEDYDKYHGLYKKTLTKGCLETGFGGAFFVTGLGLLTHGALAYKAGNEIYNDYYGYTPYKANPALAKQGEIELICGGIFMAAAIPLVALGSIDIVKATKYKKQAKEAEKGMTFSFVPMFTPNINYTTGSISARTGLGIKLTF